MPEEKTRQKPMSQNTCEEVGPPGFIDPTLVSRADGKLQLKGGCCRACGALSFPKAQVCSDCLALEIDDRPLSAQGELYAFSRVHMAPKHWDVPYTIGYIDLPEGLRIFAHVRSADMPLKIGMQMHLGEGRVGASPEGVALSSYLFTRVKGDAT